MNRERVFRRGRRATAMHLLARMGLLHELCLEEGVEYHAEDAYLTAPVLVVERTEHAVIHEINISGSVTA